MAILNFGSCTIKHNSIDLGKSFGGGTINMKVEELNEIQTIYTPELLFLSGSGVLNFFNWSSTVAITDAMQILSAAVTTFEATDMKITLYSCSFHLNKSITFGKNEQNPFPLIFTFGRDSSGNIIQIEE